MMINDNIKYIEDNYSLEDISNLQEILSRLKEMKSYDLSNSQTLYKLRMEYQTYIKNTFSPKYLKSIKVSFKHLIDYFGEDRKISTIGIKETEEFMFYIKEGAPRGYVVYLRNLKAAFNKAIDWEIIETNPFTKIKIKKIQRERPKFLLREELKPILDKTGIKIFKDMFLFSFYTGARLSEVVNIKWRNIDMERKIITIGDCEFTTKNAKTRIVPICEQLYEIFLKSSANLKAEDQYVFCKSNCFPYRKEYISKQFKKSCRAAGISEGIHFHTLRHSFGTNLSLKGTPLITIKELMGHSSIIVTQIYCHTNLESMQEAIQTFDNME